jgi:hypothetical protein
MGEGIILADAGPQSDDRPAGVHLSLNNNNNSNNNNNRNNNKELTCIGLLQS